MKSFIYYFLQFTYGILMNVIGLLAFLITICFTHNVHRHYHSFYTTTKKQFGGISLGIFVIVCNDSDYLLNHEFGHSYQNIMFGPLFVFVVAIPSLIRAGYFNYRTSKGLPNKEYDSIWFEGQATRIGTKVYEKWRNRNA